MTKNEFLQCSFEEILNLANNKNFLKQKIENQTIMSMILKSYSEDKIINIFNIHNDLINEKNEEGIPYTQVLGGMGKVNILESCVSNLNLLQKTYDGENNMLGYFTKKGFHSLVFKALAHNPKIINEKDPSGCTGTERLVDAGCLTTLECYAPSIDLLKSDYEGNTNMLGYLCKKGMFNVIEKALKTNPNDLNEKDPSGCVGTERLVDAGCTNILEQYAHSINLLKSDYSSERNMLGYISKKGMTNVLLKSLEENPNALNEKDQSGCVGTERLVDAGHVMVLEEFAQKINLLKNDYSGEKNMLGYIASKGMMNVLLKSLEVNPNALNEKDSSGCVGTERLADTGAKIVLEKFAEHIDLLKKDYSNERNMLGYLCKKGMLSVIEKSLEVNPNALNEKDSSYCLGVERLCDIGYLELINSMSQKIDWHKSATNEQSIFKYVIKKSKNQSIAEEITIKAILKNSNILSGEIKFIIDSGLSSIFSYKEILLKIDKNMNVGDMNLLAYLSNKGLEKYVDFILNPEKVEKKFFNKINNTEEDNVVPLSNFKMNKEINILPDKLKKEIKIENKPTDIKSKFKSML